MKKKGFTLLEVLVTAVISAITVGGVVVFLVTSTKLNDEINNELKAQNFFALAAEQISLDVKRSRVVDWVPSNSSLITLRNEKGNFIVAYRFLDSKLERQVEENGEWKDMFPYYPNKTVTGDFSNPDNNTELISFNIQMVVKTTGGNTVFDSGRLYFHSKARNRPFNNEFYN